MNYIMLLMMEMLIWYFVVSMDRYVLVEGYHCSCYGFDETEWDCTKLTETELKKILNSNNGELRKYSNR